MILLDVNVLVYAHRDASPNHVMYKKWLLGVVNDTSDFGLCEAVLSSFIRIVTHSKIFSPPSTLAQAFTFANQIKNRPNVILVRPGENHWEIFQKLCEQSRATGNLVADAYLAALAIESGSEWITTDRDFARFPGLKWRPPI